VEVLGFALMGNHFHLLVRVLPETEFTDSDVQERIKAVLGADRQVTAMPLLKYQQKLGNLSEFVKERKQGFTRYYNKTHNTFGFFWGQRFKSLIVEEGQTLINCLAYMNLNPVRAGLVEKPEEYRWNSLGNLLQTANPEDLLSLNFGLAHEEKWTGVQRFAHYRQFVNEIGSLPTESGKSINKAIVETKGTKTFKITLNDWY